MTFHHSLRTCLFSALVSASVLSAGVTHDDPPGEAPPTTLELAADSSLWPFRLSLSEEALERGKAMGISGLVPGIVIRLEGQDALVDFGREGLYRLPLEDTDFRERALEVRRGGGDKDLPNFIRYTANIFARITPGGKRENIPVDKMEDLPHFVVAYVDQRLFDEPTAVEAFRATSAELLERGIWTLTIPTDLIFFIALKDVDLPLVFCLPHLCGPTVTMLAHEPGDRAKFVLIDAEGKVLEEWEADYADLPALLGDVARADPESAGAGE